MSEIENVGQAVSRVGAAIESQIAADMGLLLSTKHLYQSVTVDTVEASLPRLNKSVARMAVGRVHEAVQSKIQRPWLVRDPAGRAPLPAVHPATRATTYLEFQPPSVKLFCAVCDRDEPFNLVSAEDFLARSAEEAFTEATSGQQTFVVSYECQGCKGTPEVIVIRRQNLKLTLCGRAPMERVVSPAVMPKVVRPHFSGARVAHNSGQTLAGNFLLRTTIEQWARALPEAANLQADRALDLYMDSLPPDFKSRFKSLRELYGELSEDIHQATGSPELFESAASTIVEHFEARRLFKL